MPAEAATCSTDRAGSERWARICHRIFSSKPMSSFAGGEAGGGLDVGAPLAAAHRRGTVKIGRREFERGGDSVEADRRIEELLIAGWVGRRLVGKPHDGRPPGAAQEFANGMKYDADDPVFVDRRGAFQGAAQGELHRCDTFGDRQRRHHLAVVQVTVAFDVL